MGIAIHWFRQDLRLSDNPALSLAAQHGQVLPLYILDDDHPGQNRMGAASRWWLHYSLKSLQHSLGGNLSLYRGSPQAILQKLIDRLGIEAVYWNRCYEPWRMQRDASIKKCLNDNFVKTKSTNGSVLWEPWNIHKEDGTPYKVFTPFYRRGCLRAPPPRAPLPSPEGVEFRPDREALALESLALLPCSGWGESLRPHWTIGEQGAQQRFQQFLREGIGAYRDGRNLPAKPFVSRLSPHLHFGEISPNQLWHTARTMGDDKHVDHFCCQLGWREFSYSLLYRYPNLPTTNIRNKFDRFPWRDDPHNLAAWKRGQTGVPMVDAGMRELWQTGYMHNRLRMIVGSFLVKNLLLHWKHGERWFWDTLVDADLANNSASWQWVAGCGADAAPYFRIFNPVIQGKKFDPDGEYVRRFVPELAHMPGAYLFSPWEAPEAVLQQARVRLGVDYPRPIVNLSASRARALKAFSGLANDDRLGPVRFE